MNEPAVLLERDDVMRSRFTLIIVILMLSSSLLVTLGPVSAEDRAVGDWTMASNGLPTSGTYFGVVFGDVNKDSKLDVVAASDGDGVRVFLGDGSGNWNAVPSHPATDGGYGDLVLGDYDDDGNLDIIAGSPGNGDGNPKGLHVWRGDGSGGFTDVTDSTGLPTNGNWRGVAVGDVNADGDLDVAATNGYGTSEGIHVYLGDGEGKFEDQSTGLPPTQDRDSNVVLVDFDNDGDLDVAAGGASGVDVYLVTEGPLGNLAWTPSSVGLPDGKFSGITGADWNKDDMVDLVVSAYAAGSGIGIYAYENNRNAAAWTSSSNGLPDDGDYIENAIGDIDGDGHLDIATAGSYGNTYGIMVCYGDGDGTWTCSSQGFTDNIQYVGVDLGDFNGDGTLDIVAGKRTRGGGIEVWKNPSSSAPPPQPEIEVTYPSAGDSLTGGSTHDVTWTSSSGTPPFTIALLYSTDSGATYPQSIAADLTQEEAGEGSHSWSVPDINSGTVRVIARVIDSEGQTVSRGGQDFKVDTIAPTITTTFPRDGTDEVSTSTPVIITFDEAMGGSTSAAVSISGNGDPVLSSPSWSGTQLSLDTSGFLADTRYTVTTSTGAVDASLPGNNMAGAHTFSFTTGGGETPIPPMVVSTTPHHDATGVAIGSSLTVGFSKTMDLTATQGAVRIAPQFDWTPSWTDGNTVLSLFPSSDLAPNTRFTVTIMDTALASDGTSLDSPYTWSFTTGDPPDLILPMVSGNYPPDRQREIQFTLDEVTVTFSEPMNRPSTEAAVSMDSGTIVGMTWRVEDTVLAITVELEEGERHTITLGTGATDMSGNHLAEEFSFYFVTREPIEAEGNSPLGSPLAPLLLLSLLLVAVPMLSRRGRGR